MIIKSNSILGLNLYKRIRCEEKEISFISSNIHCDDIGLYVIGENPDLEFNFVKIFETRDWSKIAYETIVFAVLSLVIDKVITIYEFEDQEFYASGLYKRKFKGYYLKTIKPIVKDDMLSKIIVTKIDRVEKEYGNDRDLKKIVKEVLNSYLSTDEHNRPQKKFITEILKRYSKKLDWLNIKETKKLLGVYKDYKVDFDRIYIPRINMQHSAIKNKHFELRRENVLYRNFAYKLKDVLDTDFERRVPKSD